MSAYSDEDLAKGKALAVGGMNLAAAAEGDGAIEHYLGLLKSLCRWQEFLTTDDFWAFMSHPPEHARMLGAVWKEARKRKWVEDTGKRQRARRPGSHAGEMVVYRSKLF